MKRVLPPLLADLAPLWVAGLGILQIAFFSRFLPLEGEPFEWAQYLALGAMFPLLVLLGDFAVRREPLRAIVGLACLIPIALWVGPGWNLCVSLGVGQAMLLLVWLRLRVGIAGVGKAFPLRPTGIAVGIAVATLGWLVAARWVWWIEFPDWLTGSPYRMAVAFGAVLFASAAVAELSVPTREDGPAFRRFANLFAWGVFALLGTHVYDLGMTDAPGGNLGRAAFHHWGAIVESADLVRQGGWPLWDIPTQYGFLNTWILAALPFASVWQSLYVCNAVLLTLSAGIVFGLLRSLRSGPVFVGFALAASAASDFLIPGDPALLTGPFPYPSVGAYRFFWCVALLGVLAWDYDALRRGTGRGRWTLWLGSSTWLAGALWSAESAVYCTTIWLPCYVLLALRHSVGLFPGTGRWRNRLPVLVAWLALPPLLLGAAVASICVLYLNLLGEMPDARCYVEYCLALQFFALPINPSGAVGVLLLSYFAIATIGAYCLQDANPLEPLPVVVGAAAALWAVSSYFVGRSHDNNVINLTPLIVACLAAALRVLDRTQPGEAWPCWIRASVLPAFTVLLVMPLIDSAAVEQYLHDTAEGYRANVSRLLPDADPALEQLLAEAGVDADTPLAFFDNDAALPSACPRVHWKGALEPSAGTRAWLPAESMVLYMPLAPERRRIYFERFIARSRRGGWLIRPNAEPIPELAWILQEVRRTHSPRRNLGNSTWTMTWYEFGADE